MSSINFNKSALVALDTLKMINKNLSEVQQNISTGKVVKNAKDNAAMWAISKVMESDVSAFSKISESLSMGNSTVAVARAATEQIQGLMQTMKENVIAAQSENQDRSKLQTDIDRMNEQIVSIIDSAQLNGVNLLKGTEEFNVLASLNRSSGGISPTYVDVSRFDLVQAQTVDTAGTYTAGTGAATGTLNATQSVSITVGTPTVGTAYSIGLTGTDGDASTFTPADFTTAGTATGAANIAYVAKEGDTASDVAAALSAAYAEYAVANGLDTDVLNVSVDGDTLTFTSTETDGTDTIDVRLDTVTGDNIAGGPASFISNIDVTTTAGAAAALARMEAALSDVVDTAAEFGSAEKRIESQMEFVDALMDSMKAGISAMTDTDMEEASARLQALQVQQQLGVQSLSIANSSSQQILALFQN